MAEFLLNGMGTNNTYQIYRTLDDGTPTETSLIISPASAGATQVYWPSGVRVGNQVYVYATMEKGPVQSIGLWRSAGGPFEYHGQVLAPIGDEGKIGMAVVAADPDDASAPWKMWYATRYQPRPKDVRFAISLDGIAWTRVGTVYTPTHADASQGFQLSHICRDGGLFRMFYSGTDTAAGAKFYAFEARAQQAAGPWTFHDRIFSPGGVSVPIPSSLSLGTRYLPVGSNHGILPASLYAISDNTSAKVQRVELQKVYANASITREPLHVGGAGLTLKSMHFNKVDPSFYYRDQNGVGRLLLTAWGAHENAANEYVIEAEETAIGFQIKGPHRFVPFGPGNLNSFENPTAIRSGLSCTLEG